MPGSSCVVEAVRHVDIFGDDDAGRHVLAAHQLIGAGAQDGAQHRLDARQRPAVGERGVDLLVDRPLILHHAGEEVAEEAHCRPAGTSMPSTSRPIQWASNSRESVADALAGHIHLVERLHGGEAGSGALCQGSWPFRSESFLPRRLALDAQDGERRLGRAAALVHLADAGARAQACASFSTVRMPLPSGMRSATDRSMSARELSPATIS